MRLKPLGITVVSVRGTQDGPLTLPALTEHAVSILYPGRGLFPEHTTILSLILLRVNVSRTVTNMFLLLPNDSVVSI